MKNRRFGSSKRLRNSVLKRLDLDGGQPADRVDVRQNDAFPPRGCAVLDICQFESGFRLEPFSYDLLRQRFLGFDADESFRQKRTVQIRPRHAKRGAVRCDVFGENSTDNQVDGLVE